MRSDAQIYLLLFTLRYLVTYTFSVGTWIATLLQYAAFSDDLLRVSGKILSVQLNFQSRRRKHLIGCENLILNILEDREDIKDDVSNRHSRGDPSKVDGAAGRVQ